MWLLCPERALSETLGVAFHPWEESPDADRESAPSCGLQSVRRRGRASSARGRGSPPRGMAGVCVVLGSLERILAFQMSPWGRI